METAPSNLIVFPQAVVFERSSTAGLTRVLLAFTQFGLEVLLSIEYLVGVPSSEIVMEWVWASDKETPVALSPPTSLCSVH